MLSDTQTANAANSCFGPNGWLHEVISPELAVEATIREIDPQQWVRRVVHDIPKWAAGVLRTKAELLQDTSQEFCLSMLVSRADLNFDPTRGSKERFLRGILFNVDCRVRKKARFLPIVVESTWSEATEDTLATVELRELSGIVSELISQLPKAERSALYEEVNSTECACPSRSVHHLRRWRAVRRLQQSRPLSEFKVPAASSKRRRFPRSRRIRSRNPRLVLRLSYRNYACAPADFPAE